MSTLGESGFERISLEREDDEWIARDEVRNVTSAPTSTWNAALEDLKEVVALETGELELSEESKRRIERSKAEFDRGEAQPLST